MKKFISICSAMVCVLSLGMNGVSAQAVSGTAENVPYEIRLVPDTQYVSASDVAAGDVHIPAKIYISGSTANAISSVKLMLESSDENVYFRNLKDCTYQNESKNTYTYSGGSFTTAYEPFCFGGINEKGEYTNYSPICSSLDYACDPKFGSVLYADGQGGVNFTVTYYASAADKASKNKTKETIHCDVTVDSNGTGTYSYQYVDQSTYNTLTATATLPRYDATLEEGEMIPSTCDSISWLTGTTQLQSGASFFGNASDEFPFMQVDIVISQGTESGVYEVGFDDGTDSLRGLNCRMINTEQQDLQLDLQSTQISVGVSSVNVTSVTKSEDTSYYSSDETQAMQASDFATILADVTTEDGTVLSNVDISNLVNCQGLTPETIFAQQAENNVFTGDLGLYYNKTLLSYNGTPLTQRTLIGKRGDVNADGTVNISDAYDILKYYADKAAGGSPVFDEDAEKNSLLYFLADVDTHGVNGDGTSSISITDASNVLQYYANQAAGNTQIWWDYMN